MTRRKSACLEDLIIGPQASIRQAMHTIDTSGLEVGLVCDHFGVLRSVITDGDIRRALLGGASLDSTIEAVGSRNFVSASPDTTHSEAVRVMLAKSIKCLPVTSGNGHLIDLHTLHNALGHRRSESWAVIMAGGFGTRLGELTKGIPKPMLPVGDRPILEHIIQHLVSHGIRRIFLSVNYLATMIEDYFGDGSAYHCAIEYLREDEPLGTAGALGLLPEAPSKPLLIMNGDLLTMINVHRLLAFHRAGEFAATMALRNHEVKVPFGVAELDGHRVERLVEKPSLQYHINAGIYVLDPATLAAIPRDVPYQMTDLFNHCLDEGLSVGAYHMQERWIDVGLPEEFARAQQQQDATCVSA